MKKTFIVVIALALLLSVFTGCGELKTLERRIDAVEEQVERKLEKAEDQLEKAADKTLNDRDTISRSDAESIALGHAGLSPEDVQGLRTEYEIDDRVPEYSVEFYHERTEYEYEIHAETGEIISFDKDK